MPSVTFVDCKGDPSMQIILRWWCGFVVWRVEPLVIEGKEETRPNLQTSKISNQRETEHGLIGEFARVWKAHGNVFDSNKPHLRGSQPYP